MQPCLLSYLLTRQGVKDAAEVVRAAKEHRLQAIDWLGLCGSSAREVRALCDGEGIRIACYTQFINALIDPANFAEGREQFRWKLEETQILGAPLLMIPTPGDGSPPEELRRRWIEAFATIVPEAHEAGVQLCLENFPGRFSPFVTAADFLEARQAVPELGLAFDTGNCFTGENSLEALPKIRDAIVHVHAKDFTRKEEPAEGFEQMKSGAWYAAALPGQGDVQLAQILGELRQSGYTGTVGIEYDGPEPWTVALRMGLDLLESVAWFCADRFQRDGRNPRGDS